MEGRREEAIWFATGCANFSFRPRDLGNKCVPQAPVLDRVLDLNTTTTFPKGYHRCPLEIPSNPDSRSSSPSLSRTPAPRFSPFEVFFFLLSTARLPMTIYSWSRLFSVGLLLGSMKAYRFSVRTDLFFPYDLSTSACGGAATVDTGSSHDAMLWVHDLPLLGCRGGLLLGSMKAKKVLVWR